MRHLSPCRAANLAVRCFRFLFIWLLTATAVTCLALDSKVRIVALEPKDPSGQNHYPILEALNRAKASNPALYAGSSNIVYDSLVALTNGISSLPSSDFSLVIGISSTDEAIALSKAFDSGVITNRNLLFLSPLVTGDRTNFPSLPFFPASLPDKDRLDALTRLRPAEWQGLNAASLVPPGTFGTLLNEMLGTNSNLCKHVQSFVCSTKKDAELSADTCFQQKIPLIFLALDTPAAIDFLNELDRNVTFLSPYKPIICFLQDYDFGTRLGAIPNSWRDKSTVVLASTSQINARDDDAVDHLNDDLFGLLGSFASISELNTPPLGDHLGYFTNDIADFFSRKLISQPILASIEVTNSQYFRSLITNEDAVVLKWLRSDASKASKLSTVAIQSHGNPMPYWWNTIQAIVPWAANLCLVGVCCGLLVVGMVLEIQKRYIFLRKRVLDVGWRLFCWALVWAALFALVIYLSYLGVLPATNYSLLVGLCLAPLSILPMLQNTGLGRFSILSQMLDWPTQRIELVMDRIINTSSGHSLREYLADIDREIATQTSRSARSTPPSGPLEPFNLEDYLWKNWFEALRKVDGVKTAQKIYQRFNPSIQVWNKDINSEARISNLKTALAFTRMVNDRGGKEAAAARRDP